MSNTNGQGRRRVWLLLPPSSGPTCSRRTKTIIRREQAESRIFAFNYETAQIPPWTQGTGGAGQALPADRPPASSRRSRRQGGRLSLHEAIAAVAREVESELGSKNLHAVDLERFIRVAGGTATVVTASVLTKAIAAVRQHLAWRPALADHVLALPFDGRDGRPDLNDLLAGYNNGWHGTDHEAREE